MTTRDALEVVREYIGRSVLLDVGSKADEALATLSELVERAGEPVAEPMYAAMIEADFEHNAVTFEMRGEYVCAAGLYEIRPHIPLTAPGASHER